MTRRIAITGVDGTGKTTLVRSLREKYRGEPTRVQAFRAPQYHEAPNSPFARLSQKIDDLSVLADKTSDPLIKTVALFLQITLFGDVESFYETTFRPAFLFTERHAVADSLSYSAFYKQLLRGPLDPAVAEPKIRAALGDEGLSEILNWVEVLKSRPFPTTRPFDLWNLPLIILDVFQQEPAKLARNLMEIYHSHLPDLLIVLKVDSDTLQKRLQLKMGSGQAPRELHEKKHVLELLQGGLIQGSQLLAQLEPKMKAHILDTSAMNEQEALREIERLAGIG